MNIEELRAYLLSKKAVSESFPFDEKTLVFKIDTKMFALVPLEKLELSINLKCNPERAVELRENYDCIKAGFHMSKKHWNTIHINGMLSKAQIHELIDHSYELVFNNLTKKKQHEINHS
mgnify:CR=1 FL=1